MRIIDRYVIFSFLKNYLITFVVLIGLYVVLDMVFKFDELVKVQPSAGGDQAGMFAVLWQIVDYYYYQGFLIFTNLAPILPGVAASFTLIRMSRSNELVALLASGVPLLRVAMPVILAAVMLISLVIINQELIIPNMIPKLLRKPDHAVAKNDLGKPIEGMREANRNYVLFAGRYRPPTSLSPATMEVVDVLMRKEDGQVEGHLSADQAVWDNNLHCWKLTHGLLVANLGPNSRATSPEPVSEYRTNIDPAEIQLYRNANTVELLSTNTINTMLSQNRAYGTIDLMRVKHTRWAQIPLNIILLLLAIPAVLTRTPGNLWIGASKSLLLTGLCMGMVFVCQSLADKPPDIAWADRWTALMAWLPIFIFGPLSVYLLDKIET